MSAKNSSPYLTTGELGDALGVQAWRIARIFEKKIISEPPRVAGRRLIPKAMIPVIVDALRARDWLPVEAQEEAFDTPR